MTDEPKQQQNMPSTGNEEQFPPRIDIDVAGIHFENPVLTASGTFGYGQEFAHLIDLNQLGGICVKGISADPMEGNPSPRISRSSRKEKWGSRRREFWRRTSRHN